MHIPPQILAANLARHLTFTDARYSTDCVHFESLNSNRSRCTVCDRNGGVVLEWDDNTGPLELARFRKDEWQQIRKDGKGSSMDLLESHDGDTLFRKLPQLDIPPQDPQETTIRCNAKKLSGILQTLSSFCQTTSNEVLLRLPKAHDSAIIIEVIDGGGISAKGILEPIFHEEK